MNIVTGIFEFVNNKFGIFHLFFGGDFLSDFLKRVYALMEKAEIKPTQLSKELGMSTSTFSDWAKGKGSPSLKAVIQFAEYFDVSMDYLVYGRDHAASSTSVLEFSNSEDEELLRKFHLLPPELRQKAVGYIEGMVSAMPKPASEGEGRLLG